MSTSGEDEYYLRRDESAGTSQHEVFLWPAAEEDVLIWSSYGWKPTYRWVLKAIVERDRFKAFLPQGQVPSWISISRAEAESLKLTARLPNDEQLQQWAEQQYELPDGWELFSDGLTEPMPGQDLTAWNINSDDDGESLIHSDAPDSDHWHVDFYRHDRGRTLVRTVSRLRGVAFPGLNYAVRRNSWMVDDDYCWFTVRHDDGRVTSTALCGHLVHSS